MAAIGATTQLSDLTWIQLNLQLLRMTGDARFGDELERSFYNHLAAAQHPNGSDWCYYTALRSDMDSIESAIAANDGRRAVWRRVGTVFLQPPGRGPASQWQRLVLLHSSPI